MSTGRTWITDYKLWWSREKRPLKFVGSLWFFPVCLNSKEQFTWPQPLLLSSPPAFQLSPSSAQTSPPQTQPWHQWFHVGSYLCTLWNPYKVFMLQAVCLLQAAGQLNGTGLCPHACWEAWTVRWSPAKAGLREALGSGGKCGTRVWIPYTWQS